MARLDRVGNMAGLMGGFAVGQGAVLATFTILLTRDEAVTVASAGLAITMFSLMQQIVDCGGMIFLSRATARHGKTALGDKLISRQFGGLLIVRLAMFAIVAVASLTASLLLNSSDSIQAGAYIGILPGLLTWCLNQQGRLDGLDRAGIGGLASGIPWLASSCVLLFMPGPNHYGLGLSLGFAYGAGLTATVSIHYIYLNTIERLIAIPRKIRIKDVKHSAKHGLSILGSWLPGQLSGRMQVALSSVLGPIGSSAFIYARNILNASNTLQLMMNRIEFPKISQKARNASRNSILTISISSHKYSISIGVIACLSIAVFCIIFETSVTSPTLSRLHDAARTLLLLTPLIITTAITGALAQVIHAKGVSHRAMPVNYLSLAVGFGTAAAFIGVLGIVALPLGSLIAAIIQGAGYSIVLRSSTR